MKTLEVNILDSYKLYLKETTYRLQGNLIVLSGINGSGKSQLLRIIAKSGKEPIQRTVKQSQNGASVLLEDILLLSFRDNINLGTDLGTFSVNYKADHAEKAWKFYMDHIRQVPNNTFASKKRSDKYKEDTLIFEDNGTRNTSWRSIKRLVQLDRKSTRLNSSH